MSFPKSARVRFEPIRALAAGGFANVFLARQLDLDREVALKVLRVGATLTQVDLKRFQSEAKVTAALSHPNVIQVIDHGIDGTTPWIAYEFLPGRNLAQILNEGPLPWRRAIQAIIQIGSGLHHAHGLGIIHRDVKPENIVEVEQDVYKIVDFGIAKWIGGDGVQTSHGLVLGTPAYMAPEHIRAAPPTPQFDIYALGIVLFELVAGTPPFQNQDPSLVFKAHLSAKPQALDLAVSGVPRSLDSVIQRALAKDPADRFPDAAGFVRALRTIIDADDELAADGRRGTAVGIAPRQRTDSGVRPSALSGRTAIDQRISGISAVPTPGRQRDQTRSFGATQRERPDSETLAASSRFRSRFFLAGLIAVCLTFVILWSFRRAGERSSDPDQVSRTVDPTRDDIVELPPELYESLRARQSKTIEGTLSRAKVWIEKLTKVSDILSLDSTINRDYFNKEMEDHRSFLDIADQLEPFRKRVESGNEPGLKYLIVNETNLAFLCLTLRNLKVLDDTTRLVSDNNGGGTYAVEIAQAFNINSFPADLEQRCLRYLSSFTSDWVSALRKGLGDGGHTGPLFVLSRDLKELSMSLCRAVWSPSIRGFMLKCFRHLDDDLSSVGEPGSRDRAVSDLARTLIKRLDVYWGSASEPEILDEIVTRLKDLLPLLAGDDSEFENMLQGFEGLRAGFDRAHE